jgi:D-alanyl-lipoteichoic acid acyltransferase DltB (MBOAT superfamily)
LPYWRCTTRWFVAGNIARTEDARRRRAWLALSLTTNLGLLGVFKYGNFLAVNVETAAAWVGAPVSFPRVTLPLPVGISFYTFEALAYSIDVFRRRAQPWTRFRDFALFLTFFPHLVAGPIVRPADFRPQLESPRRTRWPQLSWGLALLVFGLFQKVVLADAMLAPVVDAVFARDAHAGTREAWIGAFAFSGQIFCDFSGYTLCAIGAALALGFALPDNFNSPYGATGFTDFWRRWHVSLSSWLRDYLYIPLGANHGSATTDYLNALVRRFAARGGRVIWVELPSSGRTRAVEERRYPRTQYWEWFAGHVELRGSALSVHDDPALDTFRCPDGSHLDPSDAPAFTRELAGALVRRRLLRD